MTFIRYQHIQNKQNRVTNYLNNVEHRFVQHKLDGANASIWWDYKRDQITCGSRNKELSTTDTLNGFYNWVQALPVIVKSWIKLNTIRIYGEWMTPHSMRYDKDIWYEFIAFETWYQDISHIDFNNRTWQDHDLLAVPTFSLNDSIEDIIKDFHNGKFNIDSAYLPLEGYHEGIVIKGDLNDQSQIYLKVIDKRYNNRMGKIKIDGQPKPEFNSILTPEFIQKEFLKFLDETSEPWSMKLMGKLVRQVYVASLEDYLVDFILSVNPLHLNIERFRKGIGSYIVSVAPWELLQLCVDTNPSPTS